jgi:hypothetical protein
LEDKNYIPYPIFIYIYFHIAKPEQNLYPTLVTFLVATPNTLPKVGTAISFYDGSCAIAFYAYVPLFCVFFFFYRKA